jgi:hypothetical protein
MRSKALRIVLEKTSETTYAVVEGGKAHTCAKAAISAARELARANQGKKYSVASLWPAVSCERIDAVRFVVDGSAVSGMSRKDAGKPRGRPRKSASGQVAPAAKPSATPVQPSTQPAEPRPAAPPAASETAAPPQAVVTGVTSQGGATASGGDEDGSNALFGSSKSDTPAAGTMPDSGGKELF